MSTEKATSVLGVFRSPGHGFSKTAQPSITLLKGLGVEGDCHIGRTTQHLWRMKNYASEPNLRQVHLIHSELFDEPDFHGDNGVRIQPGELGENVSTTGIDLLGLSTGTRLHFVDKEHTQEGFDMVRRLAFANVLILWWICLIVEVLLMFGVHGFSRVNTMWAIINAALEAIFIHLIGFWHLLGGVGLYAWNHGLDSGFHSIVVEVITWIVVISLIHRLIIGKDLYRDYCGEHAVITITGLRHPCKKVENFQPGLLKKAVVRGEDGRIIGRKVGVMAVVKEGGIVKEGMNIIVEPPWWFKKLPVLH